MVLLLFLSSAQAQPSSTIRGLQEYAAGGGIFIGDDVAFLRTAYSLPYMQTAFAERGIDARLRLPHRAALAIAYIHTGRSAYLSQQLAGLYSMQVGAHLVVGIGAEGSVESSSDAHYPARWQLTPSAIAHLHFRKVDVGAEVGVSALRSGIPLRLRLAARYRAGKRWTTEGCAENYPHWRVHSSIEYHTDWGFTLCGGLSSHPFVAHCGVGYSYRSWRFDVGSDVHSALGTSPKMSLRICF